MHGTPNDDRAPNAHHPADDADRPDARAHGPDVDDAYDPELDDEPCRGDRADCGPRGRRRGRRRGRPGQDDGPPAWARRLFWMMGHRRGGRGWGGGGGHGHGPGGHGGPFGGRRPLRFLARKLGLTEVQFRALADVLHTLSLEREQARLDAKRATALLAEAMKGETFDTTAAEQAGALQREAAHRAIEARRAAIEAVHLVLDNEQRADMALLLRELPPGLF